MTPPFALPPFDFPLPAYVRRAESGLLVPDSRLRRAVLPGLMMSPGFLTVAQPITSITHIATASASPSSSTIAVPVEARAGDLMLGFDRMYGGVSTPTDSRWDNDWQYIVSSTGVNHRVISYWKLATASDPGSTVRGLLSGNAGIRRIWVFRPNRPIKAASLVHQNSTSVTNSNPSAITVQASLGTAPVFVAGFYSTGTGSVNPRSFTPTKDGEAGQGGMWMAWKLFLSNLQDVTIDMDDEGDANNIQGAAIMIS